MRVRRVRFAECGKEVDEVRKEKGRRNRKVGVYLGREDRDVDVGGMAMVERLEEGLRREGFM